MTAMVQPSPLPEVDLAVPVRTAEGIVLLPYVPPPVVDDGTWEEGGWEPTDDSDGGGW